MSCSRFKQGTTPTIPFYVPNVDLTGYGLYLTFKAGGVEKLVKRETDMTVTFDVETGITTIMCPMTQEDTLALKVGTVEVELKFTNDGGLTVFATDTATVTSMKTLLAEVIGQEENDG